VTDTALWYAQVKILHNNKQCNNWDISHVLVDHW